jgi:TolB protein
VRVPRLPVALLLLALSASPALATFPGRDGEIAFVREGDIWGIQADGTGLHQITSDPADEYAPAWSADGGRLAFIREGSGNGDVWTANADGSGAVQVTTTDADENHPAWSPDGSRLLYSRVRAAIMGYDLFVADADGTDETFLRALAVEADWSPAGDRIAIRAGLDDASRITLIRPDGSEIGDLPTVRDPEFGGGVDLWPTWSPDGARLAYSRGRYDIQGVHFDLTVNPIAPGEVPVVPGGQDWFLPSWSPEGTRIAYSLGDQVWVVPAAGGEPRQVTSSLQGATQPAWRPLPPPAPPGPVAGAGLTPSPAPVVRAAPRATVRRLRAPRRARAGAVVRVVLRLDGAPTGAVTLQRRAGARWLSADTGRVRNGAVTLRVRATAAGRLRLRVVFRTGGTVVRKPLSVLVRPG